MFVSRKQTLVVLIQRIESDDKPLLSPLKQMTKNRKTIAELISPNLPEEQIQSNCNPKEFVFFGSSFTTSPSIPHSLRDLRFNTIPSNLSSSSPFSFWAPFLNPSPSSFCSESYVHTPSTRENSSESLEIKENSILHMLFFFTQPQVML
uniref:Uncharacterized protein n=1 Tax=Ananas comosus var. bracteatus TaxID=296719 RepID=A0A6V7P936_ANACO|nr:unnamed protein product [Ananas comosus var. bracteatus]